MKATATFTPQAWVRDYAIDVDPEGPTEWVTEFEGLTHEQAEAILETGHDNFDLLKEDPAAPMLVDGIVPPRAVIPGKPIGTHTTSPDHQGR